MPDYISRIDELVKGRVAKEQIFEKEESIWENKVTEYGDYLEPILRKLNDEYLDPRRSYLSMPKPDGVLLLFFTKAPGRKIVEPGSMRRTIIHGAQALYYLSYDAMVSCDWLSFLEMDGDKPLFERDSATKILSRPSEMGPEIIAETTLQFIEWALAKRDEKVGWLRLKNAAE